MTHVNETPYRIAIAGLGTVGSALVKLLQNNADLITARAGRSVEIVSVYARDFKKDRGVDLSGYSWPSDASGLLEAKIDCLVELIGGSEGIALDLVKSALENSVSVVTANKALMAHHGAALAKIAEQKGAGLYFEAGVAGGIPIVKNLKEGLAGNNIKGVYGILNGTCNYILTEMLKTSRNFDDILSEAQKLGYAEADPHFDVDGIDTGHKITLLSSIAYGAVPNMNKINITGIRDIHLDDLLYAQKLGYKIKLLGYTKQTSDGVAYTVVEPCLIPVSQLLAQVDGVLNAVYVHGDFVGESLSVGPGAGGNATASSVVADIIDLARGANVSSFGVQTPVLKDAKDVQLDDAESAYYVRIEVSDKTGVMAQISRIMGDHGISLDAVLQQSHDLSVPVSVVMTTHQAPQKQIKDALNEISDCSFALNAPRLLKIENFQS